MVDSSDLKPAPVACQISDRLWEQLEPLLRIEKPRKRAGRPRCSDRLLLEGLIWLSRTGEQWAALPAVFGAKSTCHARFREWVRGGYLALAWPLVVTEHPDLSDIDWREDARASHSVAGRKGPAAIRRYPSSKEVDEVYVATSPRNNE